MKVIPFSILALCITVEAFNSFGRRNRRSASDESFEEQLEEGYQMLKGDPHADDTKRLLEQLHSMEGEIEHELALTPEQDAELKDEMKSYVDVGRDRIQSADGTIEEINRKSKVDRALYQGDMILTKEQAEEIIEDIKENEGNRKKRQAYRDRWYPRTTWSSGVTYTFLRNATIGARRAFKQAVKVWEADTCINFTESDRPPDRITVFQGRGCFSSVGRVGGQQGLSLGPGCEWVGTAAHEIGHALGFFHTQSRHDRDAFITLYLDNFQEGWLSQFTKQTRSTNHNYNITYDYGSIMHYSATGASRNRQPVMVPRDMKYMSTMGTRFLSFYDKFMMNLHYHCLDDCIKGPSADCQNGGFPHPKDCSKCICPSGYGGRLCDERPSGCGKVLTATNEYQTLEDTVGYEGVQRSQDYYKTCNYWILGPPDSTIEIVLESYSQGAAIDGCIFGGVEIKTARDPRLTGYRFCSPKHAGTTLVSTDNMVPIITTSRVEELTTVIRYRIASSGPETSKTTPRSTTAPTTPEPTVAPTTLQSTDRPNPNCKDSNVCSSLMKWDFCRNPKYDEKIRRQVCPKSCGFC